VKSFPMVQLREKKGEKRQIAELAGEAMGVTAYNWGEKKLEQGSPREGKRGYTKEGADCGEIRGVGETGDM